MCCLIRTLIRFVEHSGQDQFGKMDKDKEFDTYYTSLDDISAPIEDVYYESFSGKHHKAKVKLPNSVTVNLKENHLCKMNFESVEPSARFYHNFPTGKLFG